MRQRKPWFNKSWYISTMVLKDKIADVAGEEFPGFSTILRKGSAGKNFSVYLQYLNANSI